MIPGMGRKKSDCVSTRNRKSKYAFAKTRRRKRETKDQGGRVKPTVLHAICPYGRNVWYRELEFCEAV